MACKICDFKIVNDPCAEVQLWWHYLKTHGVHWKPESFQPASPEYMRDVHNVEQRMDDFLENEKEHVQEKLRCEAVVEALHEQNR